MTVVRQVPAEGTPTALRSCQPHMSGLELAGALLVAGSYEHCLFGVDAGADGAPALTKVFTVEAHNGAVKSLASAGGYIASGGGDDLVRCAPGGGQQPPPPPDAAAAASSTRGGAC